MCVQSQQATNVKARLDAIGTAYLAYIGHSSLDFRDTNTLSLDSFIPQQDPQTVGNKCEANFWARANLWHYNHCDGELVFASAPVGIPPSAAYSLCVGESLRHSPPVILLQRPPGQTQRTSVRRFC